MSKEIDREKMIAVGSEMIKQAFDRLRKSDLDLAEKNTVLQDVGDYCIASAICFCPEDIKDELLLSSRLHIEGIVEQLEGHDATVQ